MDLEKGGITAYRAPYDIGTVHIPTGTIHTDTWHYSHQPAAAVVDT